ncbi:MAG: CdaR family protein [Oscillospiraceae bacterium]|nr:CdaR family protein [Oscillospiraceae bacterium]
MRSVKKIFEKNITLKIISLVLAIGAWIYIMIVLNPPLETTVRGVPIAFVGQENLAERGYSIISPIDPTVTIIVSGVRSVISGINPQALRATVDLSELYGIGTHHIPVTIGAPPSGITIVRNNPLTLAVEIDQVIEDRREIRIVTTGNAPDGFMVGDISITPETVLIRGISAIVNDIDEAIVTLALNGLTEDFSGTREITFTSRSSGREVPAARRPVTDITQVEISATVMELKTVPIVPHLSEYFMNRIEDGTYTLSVTPAEITIYASPNVVADIDEIITGQMSFATENGRLVGTTTIQVPSGVNLRYDVTEVTIILEEVLEDDDNG